MGGVPRRSRWGKLPSLCIGTILLGSLLLAAPSLRAGVVPERLCENLPEVSPEVKAWVAQVAPELAQVPVRELPEKAALEVFSRASASGWGSIDLLTRDLFREPCAFHFSREALRSVDAAFDLDLPSPIRGKDNDGQNFGMVGLLAGRGKVLIFYDRDGIVYRNKMHDRNLRLASRIEFDTPTAGVLDNVHGLCAQVLLFGCVRIRSIVKDGEKVKVRAGAFTSESAAKVIEARGRSASPDDFGRDEQGITGDRPP
jgi:hypothetical protein